MYALRSSEGAFSSGTKVEIILEDTTNEDYIAVRTVGKIQKYKTFSRWENDYTKQIHMKVEDGKAKQVEFLTTEDNLVLLRERTR